MSIRDRLVIFCCERSAGKSREGEAGAVKTRLYKVAKEIICIRKICLIVAVKPLFVV